MSRRDLMPTFESIERDATAGDIKHDERVQEKLDAERESNAEYHAGKRDDVPALSSHIAHVLLARSPLHAGTRTRG